MFEDIETLLETRLTDSFSDIECAYLCEDHSLMLQSVSNWQDLLTKVGLLRMSAILSDMADCVENPLECDVEHFFNLYKILLTELGETK